MSEVYAGQTESGRERGEGGRGHGVSRESLEEELNLLVIAAGRSAG